METKLINLKGISVLVVKENKLSAIAATKTDMHLVQHCLDTCISLNTIHVCLKRGRDEDKKR